MRYMIAHLLKGEAREYHEKLSKALAGVYKLRPVTSTIDPHLTLKAPFDALSSDLLNIELIVERYIRARGAVPFTLKNFGRFEDRVVYMNAEAPEETYAFIQGLQEELMNVPWLEFKPHEKNITLHATLCYPKDSAQAEEMTTRLNERGGKTFDCVLDTITILKKREHRWEPFKEYKIGATDFDPLVAPTL